MKRQAASGRDASTAKYEVLINEAVKWRGHKLDAALRRLSRRYPRARLTIRWIPGPELLIVLETL